MPHTVIFEDATMTAHAELLDTRAVAQACATNALAVVVPCHRVVRSDGSLSGYRFGVHRNGIMNSAPFTPRIT